MSVQQDMLPKEFIKTVYDKEFLLVDKKLDNLSSTGSLAMVKNPIKLRLRKLKWVLMFKKIIGNPSNTERLNMITYLIMMRFSFDQIEAMFNKPETIADTVEEHIREMSEGDFVYPQLCDILRQPDLKRSGDIFELSARIGEALPGLIDENLRDSLQRQCRELSDLLKKVTRKYRWANLVDFVALIPLLGFPFGMLRSRMLSVASDIMKEIRELNDALTDTLSGLEPNIDLTAFDGPNRYKGWYYDYSRPTLSTGNYISDTFSVIRHLKERVHTISRLLDKLK